MRSKPTPHFLDYLKGISRLVGDNFIHQHFLWFVQKKLTHSTSGMLTKFRIMYFKDKEVFKYIIEAIQKSAQIISVQLEEFVQIEHSHVTTQKRLPVSTNSRPLPPQILHYSFDLQQALFLDSERNHMQYVFFCVQLLLPSITFLRLIHIVACSLVHLFSLLCSIPLYEQATGFPFYS